MPTDIATLRGINVSGQNIVRLERLRQSFAGLGFWNVETYVQSGNIVFLAPSTSPSTLAKRVSEAILRDFGFSVPVLIKTLREIVIKGNPFVMEKGIDLSKLHVTLLSNVVSKSALRNLEALPTKRDRFSLGRQEVYLYCHGGYGNTKLSKNKKAKTFFETLNKANLYSITYRLQTAKKPETREKRMRAIIEMLAWGEKFH